MPKTSGISTDEADLIYKLRDAVKEKITPYYDTDFNLFRWLQGYDNNFDVIVPKLLNHFKLRKSAMDLDGLADRPRNSKVHAYWKHGLTGQSSKIPGLIINIEQSGANDYMGLLSSFSILDILRSRIYDLEYMLRAVMNFEAETGKQASVLYIMDLYGLKYTSALKLISGPLTAISTFMSEHYVELIHKFVIVNAPGFLPTLWTFVRPTIPEKTRRKVEILGSSWREEILQYASPEALPAFWNFDGCNIFKANVERAEAVPYELYYTRSEKEDATTVTVAPGKVVDFTFQAEKGDRLCIWLSVNKDFIMNIFYSSDADFTVLKDIHTIIKRMNGPLIVPIEDEIVCKSDGCYKFEFSNEHAWFSSLVISYVINVKKP